MKINLGEFHELIKMGLVQETQLDHRSDLFKIISAGDTQVWSIDSDDDELNVVAFAGEDYEDIRYIGPPELANKIQAWMDYELYHNNDE